MSASTSKRITLPPLRRPGTRPSFSPEAVARPPAARHGAASRHDPIVLDSDDEDDLYASSHAGPSYKYESAELDDANHIYGKQGHADEQDLASKAREGLRAELSKLDAEIDSVKAQLEPLQRLHATLTSRRAALESQLAQIRAAAPRANHPTGKAVNYQSSSFPWSSSIRATASRTFNIPSFRLCQEGVINAAMDGRDIVCVMPTGGGKSLTYQLPAVVGTQGLTVVISPLLALIWDQVRGLKEIGVECAMMTGTTSTEEQNDLLRRIADGRGGKELRLLYVTPEKIAKSKRLISAFTKADSAGQLTRFVIDFRPDYKNLSTLKTYFPRVPILAVTATLSTKTMPDLLKILRLPPICDGHSANTTGTVFFSAPLYRPNLHYQVLPKPATAKTVIETMSKWIQDHHANASGIVYCLSKKDAETVADSLRQVSNGAIKTGVYHADIDNAQKEQIHIRWRQGKINCICATTAFGMGIDKGDVRYVIHHSMSKSLDGYYQETGRAGRDGKHSDCVLFYRGQDASRLSSLVSGDVDGANKFQEMMRFAQDLKTCRKVAFAKYFATSATLSASAWDHADTLSSTSGTVAVCGHCDNCTRTADSIVTKDVTLEAWRILRICGAVHGQRGRLTLAALTDVVRGGGGGKFTADLGKTGKRDLVVDVEGVAGGKVGLSKDDTETLLVHLLLMGYLEEFYSPTAFNVYLQPGPNALRLSRLPEDAIEAGAAPLIECTFPAPRSRKRKAKAKDDLEDEDVDDSEADVVAKTVKSAKAPRKKAAPKPKPAKAGAGVKLAKASAADRSEWAGDARLSGPEYVGSSDGPAGVDDDLLEADGWVEVGPGGREGRGGGRGWDMGPGEEGESDWVD